MSYPFKDGLDLRQLRDLPCPAEAGKVTPHKYVGRFKHYSQWECVNEGRVILGEPYWRGEMTG